MNNRWILYSVLCFLCVPNGAVHAQMSAGGTPPSFDKPVRADIPTVTTGPVDVAALLREDSVEEAMGLPFRFGTPFDVQLSPQNSGIRDDLPDGGYVWRLRIRCPGAASINLQYNRYRLPPGAELFLYDESRETVLGAFTEFNNKDHGRFATAPIRGDAIIVEYYEPAEVRETGELEISRIVHGYKDVFSQTGKDVDDYGDSGPCNINVNCPQGDSWGYEKRAVAMILLADGTRWCSGALVNNVRQDETPYFLTARHCLTGDSENWVFMFNYESPTCEDIDGPMTYTVHGSITRALYTSSDFVLVELVEQPPDSYRVFYAGWSNVDFPSQLSTAIHHPSCDIKKISFDYDPVVSSGWGSENGSSHWRVGNWEEGTTEPGSSGSPLFDQNHRIVGQLSGGDASCTVIGPDYYGKIAASWEGGGTSNRRLRDWLDPDNTGVTELNGFDPDSGILIKHMPPHVTHDTINDYEMVCTIISDTTLISEELVLRYCISEEWHSVQMSATGDDDEFHGFLPSQSAGTTINYFMAAADVSGSADTTDTFSLYVDYSAAISIDPDAISDSLVAGDSAVAGIAIASSGNADLMYIIEIIDESGYGWLTVDKTLGVVPSGASDTLACLLSSAGLDTATYTAAIIINSNDPDPEDNPLIVPVELTVFDLPTDSDGDGIADQFDNCPARFNPSQQDTDLDGNGDSCDVCEGFDDYLDTDGDGIPDGCDIICGDAGGDGTVNVSDAVYVISYVFKGGPPPEPFCSGDAGGDGTVNISDAVYIINYVFKGGPTPVEPCCP